MGNAIMGGGIDHNKCKDCGRSMVLDAAGLCVWCRPVERPTWEPYQGNESHMTANYKGFRCNVWLVAARGWFWTVRGADGIYTAGGNADNGRLTATWEQGRDLCVSAVDDPSSKPALGQDAAEASRILYGGRRIAVLSESKCFDSTRLEEMPLFSPTVPKLF